VIKGCWFGLKWALALAAVAGSVAAFCLYRRINEEIRCRVETKIAQHYQGLDVHIRSAQLVKGQGIRLRDLAIVEPGVEGPHAELLHIEEALLECPTDWRDLIDGNPLVRRVVLRRPTVRATRRPDGSWSAGKLLPAPHLSDQPPEVLVESGSLEFFDPAKASIGPLALRDMDFTLAPAAMTEPGPKSEGRRFKGMLTGDGFRRVEFEGTIDLETSACSIRGQAEHLEISPELRDSLPKCYSSRLSALGNLRAEGNLSFLIHYDPAAEQTLGFNVTGRIKRGRIDDPRLPHVLTDISAAVHVDNDGARIDNLSARSGRATVQMSCRLSGFEPDSPVWLMAKVHQLELDRHLLDILPPSLQKTWNKYHPAGRIDADVRLEFDGKTWSPEIAATCLDVSFTHYKFPYRMEHGKGTLDLKDDSLNVNLTAYGGSQPVRLTAEIAHPLSGPTGWFEARGDKIQIDETLLAALPEKSKKVVRSLDPRGTVNFYVRMWRDKPEEPLHRHLLIGANRCSICFDKFRYPLTNIRGVLEMFDNNWTFRGLEATNDTARVTCEGHFTPGLQGKELVLNFTGKNVPLEEELRDALSPHIQQVWRDLRPQGLVDLTAEVRYLPEQKKFNIGVQVQPQRETASIEPVHFPYRLERLEGTLRYRDGHVAFEHCKAEHGAVKIATEGYCDFQSDGRWRTRYEKLSVDRLRIDRELIQALPERLKKAVVELNPTGPINLRGSFDLERRGGPDEPLRSRWDVRIGMQQGSLQCGGILLKNIHGEASLLGEFDGRHVRSRGELAFDSMSYKDYQLTQVNGPIWIDDGRVLLGAWVDRRDNGAVVGTATGPRRSARPLTAKLFGGTLFGDGWVAFGAEPRYAINATLTDADLARCEQEMVAGRHKLRGKILATANLTGSGRTRNTLSGKGTIRLSEGDVYELPVMIAMLKILSVRPPDQNAFSDVAVNYRIEGEHIYFDQIDFRGDAISLRGKGEMDFQSSIRLTLHALVGRGELDLPIIEQVFSGASQQIMLIHVDGTLQNPKTRKEALPVVNQALQQLQEELNRK